MPRFTSRLVIAAALGLLAAAGTAQAAWEAPQRLDQTGEGFGNSGAGDVAVGDNGLATILFLQSDDDGTKLYATARAAGAASWLAPPFVVTPHPSGPFSIEAAPDGSTAGAYRREETDPGDTDLPIDDTTVQNVIGLGWPAGASPKNSAVGAQADQGVPPVDADGRGNGWTAFIDGTKTLKIVRFDLSDPSKNNTFEVPAVALDPQGNESLDETDSRSNPRVDANADGDVIVSFVEARREFNQDDQAPPVQKVYAVRKMQGVSTFSQQQPISHPDAGEAVNEHDPAIVENGDATVLFAGDPERDTQDPASDGPDRVFARRWLASAGAPRDPTEGPEFVSSSAADAADVSDPRAEAGPEGRVTAFWRQGGSQLNSAERSTNWTLPQSLSTNTASFDAAVDTAGVATAVFREATAVKARRRAAGQQWEAATTISSTPASADVVPKVDAGAPLQADAYFVQNDGARKGAYATRFSGAAPVEPPAPPRPETGDCPGDIAILAGDAGMNSIAGTDERETILGGDGNDTLDGNGGDDCLRGEGGNDTVNGGAGNDDVGGGDGDDAVSGGDGNDRLSGGAGTDSIKGNEGDDAGSGGDGNDTLAGAEGNDVLTGDLGDDIVHGGVGDDQLAGVDGNDRIYGEAGTNVLSGGEGNDRLVGGPQTDTVLGDAGDDTASGGSGDDSVNGGDGNDRIRGGAGRNVLDGGVGDDVIRGGSQRDRARGGVGVDVLYGFAGFDILLGGAGNDRVYGGGSADKLSGNAGRDRLRGGGGPDRVYGDSGNDRLYGDSGKDRVFGGAGRDVLNGGSARDRVYGGRGNDRIGAVDNKRDTINCGKGRDRVVADRVDRVNRNCERVKRRR